MYITPVSVLPPPEIKKGISRLKGSCAIAIQSLQTVASHLQVPTFISSSQPPKQSTDVSAPWLQSSLQALEQEEYGTDTSASPFKATTRSKEPTDTGEQAAPPNLPFRELVQKIREFLSISDPAAEEDYKLGLALGHDPFLVQRKNVDKPPPIKLPMVDDLSHLQSGQD